MIRPIVYANGDLVIGFHRLFDLVGEGEDIVGPIISDDRCREFGSVGEFLGGGAEGGEEFFDEGDFLSFFFLTKAYFCHFFLTKANFHRFLNKAIIIVFLE